MTPGSVDVARIRLDNALLLFEEFVQATVKHPDATTLRGLEGRFAERLQIQPSYWSQIKGRSRQIGERLARQFELLCKKPAGWMDIPHTATPWAAPDARATPAAAPAAAGADAAWHLPKDEDERFIVGLVLTYYRRHPQRARARLLSLLEEVLTPSATAPAPAPRSQTEGAADDGRELWSKTRAAVRPLKPKR